MKRRKYRLVDPTIEIPGLRPFKPHYEFSFKPAGMTAVIRERHPDGTETALALDHREAPEQVPSIQNRPIVRHRGAPQAFSAVTRVPVRRREAEIQLGVITSNTTGFLAFGIRDRESETSIALKTPALASTPIGRSRLELTTVGASIGASEGLEGLILGGIAGYGLHRLIEAIAG